ncbi:MAG: hypothetical protein M3Q07_22630 [Pseudobdellovibrionaceae bacterium]|nr:hypothetical protein [Pseudobdellovibrionaceae bacterium]
MVKKFFIRSFLFLSIGLILFGVSGHFLVSEARLAKFIFGYDVVLRSQEKTTKTKLVLGDSVANQIYYEQRNSPDTLVLTSVQGISMIGQYILMNKVLEANPGQIKSMSLVYIPHSFSNNLDQPYTMGNLVSAFFTFENLHYFSRESIWMLARRPLVFLSLLKFFRTNNLLTIDYTPFNPDPSMPFEPFTRHAAFLSPISSQYLKLIFDKCAEEKIECKVVGAPIARTANIDFVKFRNSVASSGLDKEFEHYFDAVHVLEGENFVDGVHLTNSALAMYQAKE